jgi:UPF0755 protein
MNFLRRRRILIATLLLVLMLLPVGRFSLFLLVPPGNGKKVEVVELGRGRSLRSLATLLQARGIISSARMFSLYARIKGGDARVKAGPYQFDDGMRPGQILDKMIAGDFYARIFAMPVGYSSYQAAEMLEKRGFFQKESFLKACRDRRLLDQLGISGESAEGYLFAGSYNILPGKTERQLLREMVLRQRELLDELLGEQKTVNGLSRREILTLASIIEKEAVLPAEKPLIAAVFQNRLRKGMRLQSDPTALYGVRAFSGRVSKEDILRPGPYNTYLIQGLPPGPIGNPGKDAIKAVLNHPAVPYLYFVSRGDGSHQFSGDLATHNDAVRRFLRSPSAPARRAP